MSQHDDLADLSDDDRAPVPTLDGLAVLAGNCMFDAGDRGNAAAVLVTADGGVTVLTRRYPHREPEGILAVDYVDVGDIPPLGWVP